MHQLEPLLASRMTRKEFLKYSALGIGVVFGFGGFMNYFTQPTSQLIPQKSTYGSGPYGGWARARIRAARLAVVK